MSEIGDSRRRLSARVGRGRDCLDWFGGSVEWEWAALSEEV